MSKPSKDDQIMRDILTRVDEQANLNQRTLAKELGIALGLANAYIKRCVRKGYIKVSQIPPNRYAYYLTPTGFSEKTRLTAEFMTDSFSFFRRAKTQYAEIFSKCEKLSWSSLALAGESELADIAILYVGDHNIKIEGILSENSSSDLYHNLPIFKQVDELKSFDAVILTDINSPQKMYDDLASVIAIERILFPVLLPVTAHTLSPSEYNQN
mgnify:CR=1 FL=1